ncbi:hypothetical protein E3N88_00780 [Mikania micrantha]|uniref:Uncharacterized protein n=1 Tax=Mikania micrantha TaxID=192012 RepID=A0A5N6PZ42_9ASTR|nr:hypothetical protein E3N88_00780 [Mikania micrantha]
MVNVGENRARNGVTDCPESRNEEKSQSMELLDSSRMKCKTLDRGRGGNVVLPAAVGQNLSTAVKGATFAYDV